MSKNKIEQDREKLDFVHTYTRICTLYSSLFSLYSMTSVFSYTILHLLTFSLEYPGNFWQNLKINSQDFERSSEEFSNYVWNWPKDNLNPKSFALQKWKIQKIKFFSLSRISLHFPWKWYTCILWAGMHEKMEFDHSLTYRGETPIICECWQVCNTLTLCSWSY